MGRHYVPSLTGTGSISVLSGASGAGPGTGSTGGSAWCRRRLGVACGGGGDGVLSRGTGALLVRGVRLGVVAGAGSGR
jgi:hypothetical protein